MIEFRAVSHTYRSLLGARVRAVDDFSLTIARGEVLGLAGPNGAGKSTLISLMLGYMAPTQGTVQIDGEPPRAWIERRGIGYLSELINIRPGWRLDSALTRFAILAGVPRSETAARVEAVIALLGVDEHRSKKVRQLSKGNLQRLGLAQALLHDEEALILDEPTHGLDPVWTQRFRDIVNDLRRPDRTIFIASHNLDELQRLADRVAIIDRGRLQRVVATRAAADTGAAVSCRLAVVAGAAAVRELVPQAVAVNGAGAGEAAEFELREMNLGELNRLLARLIAQGVLVSALTPTHSALEQQFREAVRGGAPEDSR